MTGAAGAEEGFEGEASSSFVSEDLLLLNFWLDFRGGGDGGVGERRFFFFFSFSLVAPSFTVEFDDEEVIDSLNDGNPCVSGSTVVVGRLKLPVRFLDTIGGRFNTKFELNAGLACRNLVFGVEDFEGAMIPGL